jgi:hypothetical protein
MRQIQQWLKDGTLVVRHASEDERATWPFRKPQNAASEAGGGGGR